MRYKKSIRKTLIFGSIILLVLIILQSWIQYLILDKEHSILSMINKKSFEQTQLANARYYHFSWLNELEMAFLSEHPLEIETSHTRCKLGKWINEITLDANQDTILQLKALHKELHQDAIKLLNLYENGEVDRAMEIFHSNIVLKSKLMDNLIEDIEIQYEQQLNSYYAQLKALKRTSNILAYLLIIFVIIIVVMVIYLLDKKIAKPVLKITNGIKYIRDGNFNQSICIKDDSEIGYLAKNFNDMAKALRIGQYSNEMLKTIATDFERDEVFKELINNLKKLENILSVSIYLYDEWENRLVLNNGYMIDKNVKEYFALGEGLVGQVALTGDKVEITNGSDEWGVDTGANRINPKKVIGLPIKFQDKLIGVIVFATSIDFTDSEKTELQKLIIQLGIGIHNIEQYNSIKKLIEKLEEKNTEIKHQKNYAEAVLRSSAQGIFSINGKREIQTWSKGAEEITGYKAADVIGKTCCNIITIFNQDNEKFCEKGECLFTGKSSEKSMEVIVKSKEGHLVPCLLSLAPIYNELNNNAGTVVVFSDISKQKEYQAKIEMANKVKTEFIATMSHELRTPLNSIIGFSELLHQGIAGELNSKQLNYIEKVYKSGKKLLNLINDILDISKIESGKIEWEAKKLDLIEVLKNSLVLVKEMAKEKKIELKSDFQREGLESIEVDGSKIKQVVHNLLTNAIKFTPDGGHVYLKVYRMDDIVNIEVTDTGIGIPDDKKDVIFNPFVQLDCNLNRRYEGTGLGLSLVKEIVELARGKLSVESEVGKGSTFKVEIPALSRVEINSLSVINNQDEISELQIKEVDSDIRKHRALVIEDDDVSATLVTEYLNTLNVDVILSKNGEDALKTAYNLKDDISFIILDIILPDITGWDVLAKLKEDKKLKDIPVIIISVLPEEEKGLALGAFEYLMKPISKESLKTIVEKVLSINQYDEHSTRKVLAIDDELDALEIISEVLTSYNCQVYTAINGRAGLDKARTVKPDIILLDLIMPEMDGFEILNQLEKDEELKDIPVVILTAKIMSSDEKRKLNERVYLVSNKSQLGLEKFRIAIEKAMKGDLERRDN
ncbi:response regulator [Caldisalinibacter kiritimatiensis]|uniref:histidine kinase n=1 Tax=Caldisalinibacter kiritimatiensis TaxID=1304284 RepID=R1AQ62_9FIRM|nr:response regulator [Caldisalinibacter kiritimatiensis]EOC99267.1 Two-component hybrid sensor and regulator [Caldisalinibacter kiritimatiensis]